jgi:hypothetical protein
MEHEAWMIEQQIRTLSTLNLAAEASIICGALDHEWQANSQGTSNESAAGGSNDEQVEQEGCLTSLEPEMCVRCRRCALWTHGWIRTV